MTVFDNTKILLVDLQCIPCIDYYKLLVPYQHLRFEQYEHLRKGSYSNRYYVAGANGRILLSVPLLHARKEKMPLKDLKICNRDRWQLLHWRTLTSAYRRSPWFEFYEEELRSLYDKKFEYLKDWNLEAFTMINKWLNLSWKISWTEEYFRTYPDAEAKDFRNSIVPRLVIDNPSAGFQEYHQVFEYRTGFLPGLSILDLIFCEGKRSVELLGVKRNG
ncbi:MAG: hypothetical protein EPN39_11615 [Chitinophagaceae bacterium]|nr:MAG: hypothetical protein EPN39_11615 [Chitinophagaceae bacterium]